MSTYTDLPTSICPHCGYEMNAASNADGSDAQPEPGAISVCVNCQAILEFDVDLNLIALTDETRAEIDDEAMAMIEDVQEFLRAAASSAPTLH